MTNRIGIRVQFIALGEDAQRFLAILPAIKKIDDQLDKMSPEQWPHKEACLGDTPCPFLDAIMTPEVKAEIEGLADAYKVSHADMWQNCNLLAMELREIKNLVEHVKRQEKVNPRDLRAREILVKEHEKLSVMATNFAVANYKGSAKKLRALEMSGQAENLTEALAQTLDNRKILVSKFPKLESNLVDFACMQQAVDDANDFIVDLRSEVEHGRISPNRHILALKEQGLDPKQFLAELKSKNSATFEKGELLPASALGDFAETIRADLRKHLPEIEKYAALMAVRGIPYRANVFPTTGVDLDPKATKVTLQGDMGWGLRMSEMAGATKKAKEI